MSVKTFAAKLFAKNIARKLKNDAANAVKLQQETLSYLISKAKETKFGQDHSFSKVKDYTDFSKQVNINDYEGLKTYFDKVVEGNSDILWPGKPTYFAKTSGTTSGTKFIPITKDSIPNHINSARNMLLSYIAQKNEANFLDGKLIFLQGSPELTQTEGVNTGRLSGIVAHHVPGYLQKNRLPSWKVNCIEDWETKVDAVVNETIKHDMRLISGIPPWVQMYFDKLQEKSGKKVGTLFPNFSLLVHGGVNFSPYKAKLIESIGREIDILETYPASEGFIAFQDNYQEDGLYLNVNSGIFFEFVPLSEYHSETPIRLSIKDVEIGVNYAVIINSNAGLWGYSIGDTIQFVSKDPYRIIVTGRIKHFISAFGEHVIASEVSDALAETAPKFNLNVLEFTVAPQVNPKSGLPYHEWFIEFDKKVDQRIIIEFSKALDLSLCQKNSYYNDLIAGSILKPLVVSQLAAKGFKKYMQSIGKLGGQNKVPKLSNDRKIADSLSKHVAEH
ncbi:MAG: GH3 auxin-responsive promoter family protein [Bacteroidia bacterium]